MADTQDIEKQLLDEFDKAAEKAGIDKESEYYEAQQENLKKIAKNLNGQSSENEGSLSEDLNASFSDMELFNGLEGNRFDSFVGAGVDEYSASAQNDISQELQDNIDSFVNYAPNFDPFGGDDIVDYQEERDKLNKTGIALIIASNLPDDLDNADKLTMLATFEQDQQYLSKIQDTIITVKKGIEQLNDENTLDGLGEENKKEFQKKLNSIMGISSDDVETENYLKLTSELKKAQEFLTDIETQANKDTVSRIGDVLSAAAKVVKTFGSDEAKAELGQAMSMMFEKNRDTIKSAVEEIREQIGDKVTQAKPSAESQVKEEELSVQDMAKGVGKEAQEREKTSSRQEFQTIRGAERGSGRGGR